MPGKPRPFSLHWGSGTIAEEASCETPYHVPTLQLLEFTDGEAAGTLSIRFASYDLRGRFQRMPLIVGEADIATLRRELEKTPRLRALLRQLAGD